MVELIYCAGNAHRFAAGAVAAGFLYGCPSNRSPVLPPRFVDLDYRRPDFRRHLAFVREWRPKYAVAGDAETPEQLALVLDQAAALREVAPEVIVVPKGTGMVEQIPPEYLIGYSVPTAYGATQALPLEFSGRRIHLLGGTPTAQLRLACYLRVVSADGNAAQKAARWGDVWTEGRWRRNDDRERDFVYRAFAQSCTNIAAAWGRHAP